MSTQDKGLFDTTRKAYHELEDENWHIKLMFLADITTHFNKLDPCLQGTEQIVICLFEI